MTPSIASGSDEGNEETHQNIYKTPFDKSHVTDKSLNDRESPKNTYWQDDPKAVTPAATVSEIIFTNSF